MEPNAPMNPLRKPGVYQGSPSPKKDEAPVINVLRTMRADATDAIAKQNETVASIALAEAKKQEQARLNAIAMQQLQNEQAAKAPKRHNRFFIVLMLLLALVVGRIVFKLLQPKLVSLFSAATSVSIPKFGSTTTGTPATAGTPEPVAQLAPALLAQQSEKRFALSNETPEHVSAMIAVERTGGLASGSIKNLYFSDEVATDSILAAAAVPAPRFFTFMGARAPDTVVRSLQDSFMLGLFGNDDSTAAPFIILKIYDYNTGRAGMLAWESSLAGDFDAIFATKISSNVPGSEKFRDIVVSGHDARILGSVLGTTILYTFFDPSTVIITNSQSALGNLLTLLTKTR